MKIECGTVLKAKRICKNYSDRKITIFEWHYEMMKIYRLDCLDDPNEIGWTQNQCKLDNLFPPENWDWSNDKALNNS